MGIGRIASFLSSLSGAADSATAAAADQPSEEIGRQADAVSQQTNLADDNRKDESGDLAAQLQTVVGAVRSLNASAVEQGAGVAVSAAGTQLRNAVSGLGHLLAAVDAQALASGAAGPVREAAEVIDAVEAGLADSRRAAERLTNSLPVHQAMRAQELSDRFQSDMRAAIRQVRDVLSDLRVRG